MGRPAWHRRTLLIDRRFQLKYTSWIVLVVAAVLLVLGLLVGKLATSAIGYAELATTQAEKATRESAVNSRLAKMNAALGSGNDPALLAILEDETKKVDQQMERDLSDIAARKQAVTTLRASLLVSLVAGGAVLLGALFFTGVLVTRRVVGPVFKIKRLLRRVGTGRLVVNERLRRGDELEDLFDTFLQMTYSLTALQRGRLATLDATIARAERAGTSQDVMDGLHALRAQMALGLESKGARS